MIAVEILNFTENEAVSDINLGTDYEPVEHLNVLNAFEDP